MIALPAALGIGTVVGRFGEADDAVRFVGLPSQVIFVPSARTITTADLRLLAEPVYCSIDSDGYLCRPSGARGVTLIEGTYRIAFSPPSFPSFSLTIAAGETVDLATMVGVPR